MPQETEQPNNKQTIYINTYIEHTYNSEKQINVQIVFSVCINLFKHTDHRIFTEYVCFECTLKSLNEHRQIILFFVDEVERT